jgi:hypothetical protein
VVLIDVVEGVVPRPENRLEVPLGADVLVVGAVLAVPPLSPENRPVVTPGVDEAAVGLLVPPKRPVRGAAGAVVVEGA